MKQIQIDDEGHTICSVDKFLDHIQSVEAAYIVCPQRAAVKSNIAPVLAHMSGTYPAKSYSALLVEVATSGVDGLQGFEHGRQQFWGQSGYYRLNLSQ